tara:strand:+ start:1132 stop:1548 length:417 start_codon:yes stop_codon:yes gene_type:complete
MAREYLRSFTKIITVNDGLAHTVDLDDSEGTIFGCNYITVEAVSGTGSSYFTVIPSGTGVAMPPTDYVASTMLNLASGVNSLATNNNGGSVVLGLAPDDRVKHIVLSQGASDIVNYIISYGNVYLANQIADNTASRGG